MQEHWQRTQGGSLPQTLNELPIYQTARSVAKAELQQQAEEAEFVSLLGARLMAPQDTLIALLSQLPPTFIHCTDDAQRSMLRGLGVKQLRSVEFYRCRGTMPLSESHLLPRFVWRSSTACPGHAHG